MSIRDGIQNYSPNFEALSIPRSFRDNQKIHDGISFSQCNDEILKSSWNELHFMSVKSIQMLGFKTIFLKKPKFHFHFHFHGSGDKSLTEYQAWINGQTQP